MKYLSSILVLTLLLGIAACDLNQKNVQQDINQQLLDLFDSAALDENVVKIYDIHESEIIHAVQDGWENAWVENKKNKDAYLDPGDELCRGDGISFARCVRDAVDEGKCVKVYKDGDDYVGEEMACDE